MSRHDDDIATDTSGGDFEPFPVDSGCPRGCPDGECYHGEPMYAETIGMCDGCGGIGECLCGED